MLEISTRPWLYSLSQKYGRQISKLSDIPSEELQAIVNQKYDVVWFMGVWSLGEYGLHHDRTDPNLLKSYANVLPGYTEDDIIGSPYAVTNYTCNSELGSDQDLLALKRKLNALGLKLMLDFVPNHSAVDSPMAKTKAYYMRDARSAPPYDPSRYLPNGIAFGWSGWGDAWTDTAQLNYWNQDLRQVQIQNLLKIASVSDYIRCDMAYLALNDVIEQNWNQQLQYWKFNRPNTEFWGDAISIVKQKFQVQFLAEVYSPWQKNLQALGFDFTYDKVLYDHLGDGNLDNLRGYIAGVPLNFHEHSAHFVENHDEPRAAAFFGGNMRADAAAMVTMTLPGMRFYNTGQNEGFFNRLDVHLRRAKSEGVNGGVVNFYSIFTSILARDIFHQGQWTYMNVFGTGDSWRLMSWKWSLNEKKVLCVINYSDQQGTGRIVLPDANPVGGNDMINVTELISGAVYQRSAKDLQSNGIFVVISYWSMQMLEYQ